MKLKHSSPMKISLFIAVDIFAKWKTCKWEKICIFFMTLFTSSNRFHRCSAGVMRKYFRIYSLMTLNLFLFWRRHKIWNLSSLHRGYCKLLEFISFASQATIMVVFQYSLTVNSSSWWTLWSTSRDFMQRMDSSIHSLTWIWGEILMTRIHVVNTNGW